jgi:hypothetical protein
MKKAVAVILFLIMIFTLNACTETSDKTETTSAVNNETAQTTEEAQSEEQTNEMKVNININGKTFTATLEDNVAAKELYEIIRAEGLTVEMSDYSGFEKVGSLGRTLTADDKQTRTKSGDIVLYNGSQLVMFYGTNSWSYTRLGKIDNLSGWEEALGSGDITAEFSVG